MTCSPGKSEAKSSETDIVKVCTYECIYIYIYIYNPRDCKSMSEVRRDE